MFVTGVAVVVGGVCLFLGVGLVRVPTRVETARERLPGTTPRPSARGASLGRGLFYLWLGLLCLAFALVGHATP